MGREEDGCAVGGRGDAVIGVGSSIGQVEELEHGLVVVRQFGVAEKRVLISRNGEVSHDDGASAHGAGNRLSDP